MNYQNALDFLLYSYFGLDDGITKIEKKSKDIKDLCAHRAYLDLARTVKFKYTTSRLDEMKKKNKSDDEKKEAEEFEAAKKKLINEICKTMLDPRQPCKDDTFAEWHRLKCNHIIQKMNDSTLLDEQKPFTYGQAQKWLNMTLKYLWLLDMLPEGLTKKSLHVPIDRYIIQAAKSKDKNEYGLGLKHELSKTTWSSWNDYNAYIEYQQLLKDKIAKEYPLLDSPIDWEGKAWIEISKKERTSEEWYKESDIFSLTYKS